MRPIVCVDLDGVLADYSDGWKGVEYFGNPIPGAVEFTRQLAVFADIVIFTCRCSPEVQRVPVAGVHLLVNRVREWLDANGFVYHEIYSGVGKPFANAYVDDRAVFCNATCPAHYKGVLDSIWSMCIFQKGKTA